MMRCCTRWSSPRHIRRERCLLGDFLYSPMGDVHALVVIGAKLLPGNKRMPVMIGANFPGNDK